LIPVASYRAMTYTNDAQTVHTCQTQLGCKPQPPAYIRGPACIRSGLYSRKYGTLNSIKCEALWIKIITGVNCFINLGVCYHSPNASSEEVENMFSSIKEVSKQQTVIVGDFNFLGIEWNSFEGKNLYEEIRGDMWQIFIGKLQAIIMSYVRSKKFLGENIVHGFIAEQENN